ncbi:hypothetical protein JXO52_07660 [bacterium]|nr:hypothetical protein [bacterium]
MKTVLHILRISGKRRCVSAHLAAGIIAVLFLAPEARGQAEITVTGLWSLTLDNTNLQAGAGSDFVSTYESAVDQVDIEISGRRFEYWQVDISITGGASWHDDLVLYARRTGDGQGAGWISGGTAYQEVTTTSGPFFQGYKKLKDITIQYQLSGVSVVIPAGTYSTSVVYTVTDL